jgi:carboxylesterase type B
VDIKKAHFKRQCFKIFRLFYSAKKALFKAKIEILKLINFSGVNHGDELYLQWDPVFGNHHELSPEDQLMSAIIVNAWSNFIKTGVPLVPGVDWTPLTPEKREYLVLNVTSRMERSLDYQARMEFWKQLFPC